MNTLEITIGQAFLPIFHCEDPFISIESPRGCLKTCSILHILMSRAARWPGHRWYIWQSTRTLLSTTVLPSFEKYVIPCWSNVRGMRLLNPNARPSQRTEYLFENGSVFTPVGLDDLLRGTSSEGAGGYLAEAVQLHSRDQATALVGMMREPGVPFHQILVDTNPGAPGHWLNTSSEPIDAALRRVVTREDYQRLQRYNATPAQDPINGRWKRIVAKIMDNPFYFDVEAWKMRPAGESYLRGLGTLNGHLHARWVLGEWKAAEGAVFPELSERNYCDSFGIHDWPVVIGYDPGYRHACAVVFYAVAPDGQPFIVDEIYGPGMTLQTVADRIKDKLNRHRYNVVDWLIDPAGDQHKQDASGRSIMDQMSADHGIRFRPWPRAQGAAKQAQVEAVRSWLTAEPPLQIFRDKCPNVIMEMQSWEYKKMADGSMPTGDDAYVDLNNDAIDALCGIVATRPSVNHRPAGLLRYA